jgi:hypothetical protein
MLKKTAILAFLVCIIMVMGVGVGVSPAQAIWVCPSSDSCYQTWNRCVMRASGGCPNGCGTGHYPQCDAALESCIDVQFCYPVY